MQAEQGRQSGGPETGWCSGKEPPPPRSGAWAGWLRTRQRWERHPGCSEGEREAERRSAVIACRSACRPCLQRCGAGAGRARSSGDRRDASAGDGAGGGRPEEVDEGLLHQVAADGVPVPTEGDRPGASGRERGALPAASARPAPRPAPPPPALAPQSRAQRPPPPAGRGGGRGAPDRAGMAGAGAAGRRQRRRRAPAER